MFYWNKFVLLWGNHASTSWCSKIVQFLVSLRGVNPLKWRHNERDGVSNHQPHDCLLNLLFRGKEKNNNNKKPQQNIKAPRHWPLCGDSPVTGEFPAEMASNAENVSIWWRHHGFLRCQQGHYEFLDFKMISRILVITLKSRKQHNTHIRKIRVNLAIHSEQHFIRNWHLYW